LLAQTRIGVKEPENPNNNEKTEEEDETTDRCHTNI
jgi:hypothetical protein